MGSSEQGEAPDPKILLWFMILIDELLEQAEDGIQQALGAIDDPKRSGFVTLMTYLIDSLSVRL